jgi:hypothetical protein
MEVSMLLKLENHGPQVRQLQEGLALLGFHPGAADGKFGPYTEEALTAFQTKIGIYPDGLFGPLTMGEFNAQLDQAGHARLLFFNSPSLIGDPPEFFPKVPWVQCPVDKWGSSFRRIILREDAAASFRAFREDVLDYGGIVASTGGRRNLAVKAGPTRAPRSWHYLGRAFDLSRNAGMRDPVQDPYVLVRHPRSNLWEVWCKITNPLAPRAPGVEKVSLEVSYVVERKSTPGRRYTQILTSPWEGRAFNLTEIAKRHGFEPIRPRAAFFQGGPYSGAEWWHFQWTLGVSPGDTFGGELVKVYTLAECREFPYWEAVKDSRYGECWG